MPQRITEAAGAAVLTRPIEGGRRFKGRIIEGDRWGSSGYYSREVLERDGPTTWPAGTQVYLDHPTVMEDMDRPERSVRDLAGRINTTPVYEGDGLYAEIEFYPHVAPVIEAMWEDVGMSIRASAAVESGEADGRRGPIIQALMDGESVDVVTKAGAGGKLVSLLESARSAAPWAVRETTANDVEMWLDAALRDRFAGTGEYPDYPYSRDHDDQYVYYRHQDRWWRLPYTVTPTSVTLDGEPVEVRRRTEYDPVDTTGAVAESPAGPGGAPHHTEQAPSKKESDMPEITQEELTQLRENASRATQLEAENNTLREASETAARQTRMERATAAVREAFGADAPAFYVNAAQTAAESADYDHEAFTATVNEAAAASDAANGAGEPSGVGHTQAVGSQSLSIAEADQAVAEAFGRNVKEA